jgi:TraK protein
MQAFACGAQPIQFGQSSRSRQHRGFRFSIFPRAVPCQLHRYPQLHLTACAQQWWPVLPEGQRGVKVQARYPIQVRRGDRCAADIHHQPTCGSASTGRETGFGCKCQLCRSPRPGRDRNPSGSGHGVRCGGSGLLPVRSGDLSVQLVSEYQGLDLTGRIVRIENLGSKPALLSEAMVAPKGAVAVSIANARLASRQATSVYVVTPRRSGQP